MKGHVQRGNTQSKGSVYVVTHRHALAISMLLQAQSTMQSRHEVHWLPHEQRCSLETLMLWNLGLDKESRIETI